MEFNAYLVSFLTLFMYQYGVIIKKLSKNDKILQYAIMFFIVLAYSQKVYVLFPVILIYLGLDYILFSHIFEEE